MMQKRAQRWPSAWGFELSTDIGDFAVTIVNVSTTGALLRGRVPVEPGSRVRLCAMQQPVGAVISREDDEGVALKFDRPLTDVQLASLRQYRDLRAL